MCQVLPPAQITSHRTWDNGTRPRNSCLYPGDGTVLIANVLTVAFVYCFAKVHQKELKGEEQGRFTYLWLIVLVFLFMLCCLYIWVSILLD